MPSKQQKKWHAKKGLKSATHDLPLFLLEIIDELAAEYGVPKSQMVATLLICGLEPLRNGQLDLSSYMSPSRSPLYEYNIDLNKLREDWSS